MFVSVYSLGCVVVAAVVGCGRVVVGLAVVSAVVPVAPVPLPNWQQNTRKALQRM